MGWLQDIGVAEVYAHDIQGLNPLLEAMSARGMPVSLETRAQVLDAVQQQRDHLLVEIRALVPEAVCKLKVYKKKPSMRLPFVPSTQQLVTYLKHKGLRVPTKDGRDTTEETALRRLALANPQDPVLPLVLHYREVEKDRQFVEGLQPGPDGCLHTVFTHNPSTLRLASERPNLQNLPR